MTPHDPPCHELEAHRAQSAEGSARLSIRVDTLESEYERLRASKHDHGDRLTRVEGEIGELRRDDGRQARAVEALEAAVAELKTAVSLLAGSRSVWLELARWIMPVALAAAAYAMGIKA